MKRPLVAIFLLLFLCVQVSAQEQFYIRHKVRWMETLYSIARKYKVEAKEIAILNNLTTGTVERGQILLIPDKDRIQANTDTTELEIPVPKEEILSDQTPARSSCADYRPSPSLRHNISLLLPLSGTKNSSSFLEFYQGVLIAAQEMKQMGMNADIQCFDWNAQSPDELLSGERLAMSELIIGPVYSPQIGNTLAYFRDTEIKIVSPLDVTSEAWVSSSPHLFQVQPTQTSQQEAVIKKLDPHNASVWLISEEGDQEVAPEMRALLDEHHIPYRSFIYDVLRGREVTGELRRLLGPNGKNQIIIASQNEAFVSDALRNLHLLFAYDNIPIELFGMSKWRSFETLDLAALHQLKVVIPLPVYVDYSRDNVKRFVRTFRALFHAEPSHYAFQGYDVAFYFMNALFRYGPDFEDCIDSLDIPLLQSEYSFRKNEPDGGYSNTEARLIRYLPDYTVTLLP